MAERQDAGQARGAGGGLLFFEHAPVALWLEDLSAVRGWLEGRGARSRSVTELLARRPQAVVGCLRRIRVLDVNEAAVRLYRAPDREALLAGPDRIVRPPEVAPAVAAILEALLAGEETATVRARQRTWDGAALEVTLGVSLLPEARHDWSRVLVSVHDLAPVARMRERLRALRESEAKFRELAEKALVGVYLVQDGVVRYANPRLAEIFGYRVEEIVETLPVSAFIHPEDRELVERNLRRRLEGEAEALRYRFRGLRRDGTVVRVEVYGVRTVHRGRPAVLGTLLDVTAQIEAEARERRLRDGLLALGRRSRALLEARSDERRFREAACEGARELVAARGAVLVLVCNGVRQGQEDGASAVTVAGNATELAGLATAARAAAREGQTMRIGLDSGGHALVLPVQAEGETAGALAVALSAPPDEVAERLLGLYAERLGVMLENLRLLRSLEERVARRTSQLELANRELESFAYSVSHDLRAPLRAIDGFARAVLEDHGERLPPEGRAYLERVCHAAERMGRLIDDLLALSRVTRREMHRRRVDLSALARAIADELAADEPGRAVDVRIAPGLAVEADPGLVRLLLENLLRNAWKYTRPRTRAVVEFGAERGGAGATVFFVRDNGVGFDMRHAGRLFQPFQRLHRDEEFEGTGIGLATALRVVRRHGGRIWAEAEPGRGAVFRFTLEPEPGALTEGGPGL